MNISLNDSVTTAENYYIFDRLDIRIIFISLYSVVFCSCFFGNLLVILVVTLSRRLRSVTNFFLANLALADLCVGVFCVYQNLSIYLITSWVFGDFMCKMYQYIHSLSYTASIFILVVISIERYFAIIHPITCKQILTTSRLKWVMAGVWLTSAIYSAPKFIWVQTITNDLGNNQTETICIQHRKKYDSELFDIINFCFLYLAPLCIISVLYTRIAVGLWKSSRGLETIPKTELCRGEHCIKHCGQSVNSNQLNVNNATRPVVATWRARDGHSPFQQFSHQSQNVLRARRRVIRMLVVIVLTFALCNLPFHARKMWQYWSPHYQGGSDFSSLFTPLTFLVTYFNSGINPILYAFLSRNFRSGMRELIFCNFRGSQKKKKHMLIKENSINQMPPLNRRGSTKSTRLPLSSISHATSSDTR